jgi:nucleotide-binding universal stress UspA family protein
VTGYIGMTGFHRVVVGLDGSESAGGALMLAQRLVDPDGTLILAGVDAHRSFRMPYGRTRRLPAEVLETARAELEGLAATCIERVASSVARGLTEIADEQDADLLVLGSRDPAPEGRVSPGRTALRLLQGGPCAVAVAPAGAGERDRFHHVGVAYDGSPEARAALAAAYAVAAKDGAAMSLFFAVSSQGAGYGGVAASEVDRVTQQQRVDAQEQLDAAADEAPDGVNPRTVLLRGNPAQEIALAASGIVDVLFTGSRGYGPMHRALAGSVAEALLLAATEPVVVLPRCGIADAGHPDAAAAAAAPALSPRP